MSYKLIISSRKEKESTILFERETASLKTFPEKLLKQNNDKGKRVHNTLMSFPLGSNYI